MTSTVQTYTVPSKNATIKIRLKTLYGLKF